MDTAKLAIIVIGVLEALNMVCMHADGAVLSSVIGTIAGIAGYRAGSRRRRR
jgi:hypothetical protein